MRKTIKTRGHFSNDESAIKLLWLAQRILPNNTVRSLVDWQSTMNRFAILHGERFAPAKCSKLPRPQNQGWDRPLNHFSRKTRASRYPSNLSLMESIPFIKSYRAQNLF
jgi:hypothetical protein